MWNVSFNWVVMLQKSTYGSSHIFYVYHNNIPKCIRKAVSDGGSGTYMTTIFFILRYMFSKGIG